MTPSASSSFLLFPPSFLLCSFSSLVQSSINFTRLLYPFPLLILLPSTPLRLFYLLFMTPQLPFFPFSHSLLLPPSFLPHSFSSQVLFFNSILLLYPHPTSFFLFSSPLRYLLFITPLLIFFPFILSLLFPPSLSSFHSPLLLLLTSYSPSHSLSFIHIFPLYSCFSHLLYVRAFSYS